MPTVTNDGLREYLEAFHRIYRNAVEDRVPSDLRESLARVPRLSDGITGYISTQFGAGFEYVRDGGLTIRTGSRRIEELFFDAPARVRKSTAMFIVGAGCGISGATLEGGFPVRLNGEQASVKLADIRAKVGPWVREVEWAEMYGDRSATFWSVEMAAERAMGEILQAVVDAREMERRHLDLGAFLSRFRQRRILLLGDFRAGRDRLSAIAKVLEKLGYLPIFADEIPDVREHDLRQKISLLALSCRFVVIEDSTPAGQLTELPLVEASRVVAVVLRLVGSRSSWMTDQVSQTSSVIKEDEYEDATLEDAITKAVSWAEVQLERLGRTLDERFPWRHI